MTTKIAQQQDIFRMYPKGSLNKNGVTEIVLKDNSKKYMYVVYDYNSSNYHSVSCITDLKRQLNLLYGFDIKIKCSNKNYYVTCNRFEMLTPDSVNVYDSYGLIAKVKLYCNLTYTQFQNIAKKGRF